MPGIIDRLAAAEAALMLTDLDAILANDDVLSVCVDLGRTAHSGRQYGILVVVEADEASLADRGLNSMEAIELARVSDQIGSLFLEDVPDRALWLIDMFVGTGVIDAFVQQPPVQLPIGLEA